MEPCEPTDTASLPPAVEAPMSAATAGDVTVEIEISAETAMEARLCIYRLDVFRKYQTAARQAIYYSKI